MWTELIRVEVTHQDPFMPKPVSVWARIDYEEKDGCVNHSFQFATMRDGQLEPIRFLNFPQMNAMQKAIKLITVLSLHFKAAGADADPKKARGIYEEAVRAADEEVRQRMAVMEQGGGGMRGFLQLLAAGIDAAPEVVGNAEGVEAVKNKAETALRPLKLGTLGDRAMMRPLGKKEKRA